MNEDENKSNFKIKVMKSSQHSDVKEKSIQLKDNIFPLKQQFIDTNYENEKFEEDQVVIK